MFKHIRKHKLLYGLIIILLYFIVGATFPFSHYEEVSNETKDTFNTDDFFSEQQGSDRAMILETNQSAWDERLRLLNMAEKKIILTTYDLRDGESTRDLFAILLQKADEGVSVQILADGICGLIRMEGRDVFTAVSAHPNIEIRLYNKINPLKPWNTQGRMHDKYVLVDDIAYIMGGRNTFDYFLGSYDLSEQSLDREVLIYNTEHGKADSQSSSLHQLENYFELMWNSNLCSDYHEDEKLMEKSKVKKELSLLQERYKKIQKDNENLLLKYDYTANTHPTNKVSLISNPTEIHAKEPIVFYKLTELMKTADERVKIHTPYAVCNSYMYERLAEVCEKVPDTTILLNSVHNGDNIMASSDYIWNRDKLLDTKIVLYEYNGGTSYHGKSILIDDDISIIGSYNLDLRSTYVNTELMLVIQSRRLNAELEKNMEILQTADSVIPEAPLWKKALLRLTGGVMQCFRYLI